MHELNNKTVVITGASSGIGAAAAALFAAEGANVVLGARREAALETLVREIRERNGVAVALAGDVKDEAYSRHLVMLAETEFGGVDAAFNNAGIVGEMMPVAEMSASNWTEVLTTNLTAAFFAAKYQIPAMQKRGGGSIVFTSTFVGYANGGPPGMGAYAASKAGLIGLTQSVAAEHGADGIRVNALLPGGTKTAMAGDDPEALARVAGLHPLGRMAESKEIANAALFLLSDRGSFVTGSAMMADGGVSIRFG
ncbi:MAG: SDR family oxidoreductase [Pseudomonadota bacterium]